jgi:DNA repair protein SbcC/Rad50
MIPKLLTLKNFLSYREVTLDFAGLHVACVCGPNGAGKSSLLEAIAWCVWGQSRVSAEDDIVRQGAIEAQVSFCFELGGQTYRIIRTRRRNQISALEFQIETKVETPVETLTGADFTFKTLTQKGVRATQQYILAQIKIDYETFVNAAYLRQGRADEFMLKRPSDRKQVLADLLKLNRYDSLAEQAKEQSRSYKHAIQPLEALITRLAAQKETHEATQLAYEQLQAEIEQQQQQQQQQQQALSNLQQQWQQRSHWQQQLALATQQQQHQQLALQKSQAELATIQQQLQQLEAVLAQADDIQYRCEQLTQLRQREEQQAERFHAYQAAQSLRLQLQQKIGQQLQQQQQQIAQIEGQLAQLQLQEQEIQTILDKKTGIIYKLEQLRAARKALHQLDKTEAQSAPLRQRLQQIEGEIGQAHTRLVTRIEELGNRQSQMTLQQTHAPQLIQAAVEVSHRIAYLEQRRDYQEALRQKGLERRSFMERLQANQLNHEVELARFDQTLRLLENPDEAHCPLCEQSLDGGNWQILRDRTLQERDDVQNQIWAIREQLAVSDSEIQVLRQEYRVLEEELAKYAPILEERGLLKAKLGEVDTLQDRLQEMSAERAQLERCLQENDYAETLQNELQQLQQQIASMAYDDRNHALVRSQVERLRWSELKYAEIRQAERRLTQIQAQRPELEDTLKALQLAIAENEQTADHQALAAVHHQLNEIDYNLDQHNHLRAQIKQARLWEAKQSELQQAQSVQAEQQAKIQPLIATCQQQIAETAELQQRIEHLQQQLIDSADPRPEMVAIENALIQDQQLRDRQLSARGRLQQQLSQIETVQSQYEQQQQQLEDIRHKYQVYKALAEAFGPKGIQSLMIENLLPQLEAETNQILARLSDHQLHVQFVTQKLGGRGAGRQKKNQPPKFIDTLDILIADTRGTRPYETYSGGEAFRVNFAIRLAIARLLAMRSGTALQMLIVDEGFGTQDKAGCDRLIAAIEAIAPDFACILTITHMPHFREAFQTRIDVAKDENGSQITISG